MGVRRRAGAPSLRIPRPGRFTSRLRQRKDHLGHARHGRRARIPKGEANAYLGDPNYDTLNHRLENAHSAVEGAAVEARRRVRLNEGR